MKVVIPAAGIGTRLLPATKEQLKEMLPLFARASGGQVCLKPLLQLMFEQLYDVGFRESQTRSFCYVSDMVEGLMKLMFLYDLNGEVINLGNPEEITILKVAELVKKLAESNSKITFAPLPKDDPKRRNPDISKAKKMLGWTPEIRLKDGLPKTISYFREAIK